MRLHLARTLYERIRTSLRGLLMSHFDRRSQERLESADQAQVEVQQASDEYLRTFNQHRTVVQRVLAQDARNRRYVSRFGRGK